MAVPGCRARLSCPVAVAVSHGRVRWPGPGPWLWPWPWPAIAVAVAAVMVVAVAGPVVGAVVAVPGGSDRRGSRDDGGAGGGSAGRGGQEVLELAGCSPRRLAALIASRPNVPNVFAHAPQFTHFA